MCILEQAEGEEEDSVRTAPARTPDQQGGPLSHKSSSSSFASPLKKKRRHHLRYPNSPPQRAYLNVGHWNSNSNPTRVLRIRFSPSIKPPVALGFKPYIGSGGGILLYALSPPSVDGVSPSPAPEPAVLSSYLALPFLRPA